MKSSTKRGKKKPRSGAKLFLFSEEDEQRIATAIELSKRFMKSYGKGSRPSGLVSDYSIYN